MAGTEPMQRVAKRARFVAREDLFCQRELLRYPQHKLNGLEPLRWLRRAPIDDPHDHIAVQMHVDSRFDRLGLAFRRIAVRLRFGFAFVALGSVVIHRGSGILGFPAPDHPCYLSQPRLFPLRPATGHIQNWKDELRESQTEGLKVRQMIAQGKASP